MRSRGMSSRKALSPSLPSPDEISRAPFRQPRQLRFAERLSKVGKPTWVRFTLVPDATDDPDNVEGIARFVAPMKNVQWVEVQPFHQMGAFKWKAMGLEYKHSDTKPPSPELIARVIGQFKAAGCNAR